MTTLIVLNSLFAVLIVGALAAVCRAGYGIAGRRIEALPRPILIERQEEQRLAA
jgi:hypothetical protein